MDLYFLGTGAGMPSRQRNVTSIALRMMQERGTFWLFDCGEGTQHRILESPLRLSRLEKVFITHLHGDHVYGLPGLLGSRSAQDADSPLEIYGPAGIRPWVESTLAYTHTHLGYEIRIHEVAPPHGTAGVMTEVFQDKQFTVKAAWLHHGIPSLGYRIEESPRPGRLRMEALSARGIQPGPHFSALKRGEDVVLPDGVLIRSSEYVDPPRPGHVICILGDTELCPASERLAKRADVLVHEATFRHDESNLAHAYHHSTATEAAQTAKRAEVGTLVLTHISARYAGDAERQLLSEAASHFSNTILAQDFMTVEVTKAGVLDA